MKLYNIYTHNNIKMKQQINEIKRMQQLAGIILENQLNETKLFANFNTDLDSSLKSRFARSISEIAREYEDMDSIDISGYFDEYQDGDDFYAGPTEALEFFQTLPNEFTVTNNIDGDKESFKITKIGSDSFKVG